MTRTITFQPAFDKRHAEDGKNYGVHGANMRWILKGELGAIQFVVYTNWHLPHVQEELDRHINSKYPHLCCHPQPADVGYHSPKPLYEGQIEYPCDILEGDKCYYDGSGLRAEDMFQTLVSQGDEAVWKEMEQIYIDRFEELK